MNSISNSLFDLYKVHPSWKKFITQSRDKNTISLLKKTYKNTSVTPSMDNALRFLELPLNGVKIIILGQDPYPQEGVATGRAFEVGTLYSWDQPFRNISLKNIVRSIYHAYNNQYLKFNDIKKELSQSFDILPPDKLFKNWEQQGVLLLNTSFTCEIGHPSSHKELWESFTQDLLSYIAKEQSAALWFIWGNHAKEAIENIPVKHKIETMHPMMCYDKPGRDNDFLFGKVNAFKKSKDLINWTGIENA